MRHKINPQYANSTIINYNRWSEAPEVDSLTRHILSTMQSRKRNDYTANMKVILLNLYHSYLTDLEQYIAYHRSASHYCSIKADRDSRYYKNPHISRARFVGAVDHLVNEMLIEDSIGGNFSDEEQGGYGFLSRMRAAEKLVDLFDEYKITPQMIGKFSEDEVIVLRGIPYLDDNRNKIKPLINYKGNRKTIRMRKIALEYNRMLDTHDIMLNLESLSSEDIEELVETISGYDTPVIKIDLNDKQIHRVFNNKSWTQGGRFYGAWWISCPSLLRKYITIDGKQTVELDYSGIHVHLLYAMQGINYAELKEDPYTLDDDIPDRDLNKLIFLTALNAADDIKARDSVYDKLRRTRQISKYNLAGKNSKGIITAKLNQLKQKHSRIAKYIAQGEGIFLQYHDSCIIEKLIKYSTDNKIPILTVHDSVITQIEHQDAMLNMMIKLYGEYIDDKLGYKYEHKPKLRSIKYLFTRLLKGNNKYRSNINSFKVMNNYRYIVPENTKARIPYKDNNIIVIKYNNVDKDKSAEGINVNDRLDINEYNRIVNIRISVKR